MTPAPEGIVHVTASLVRRSPALLGLLVSISAALATLFIFAFQPIHGPPSSTTTPATGVGVARLQSEMKQLQSRVASLEASGPHTPRQRRIAAQLAQIRRSIRSLAQQLSAMNQTVLENPSRAIQLPLLRRDLTAATAANAARADSLRADVDHQYDLIKALLGAFVAGILGTSVALVGALRKKA